MSTFLIMFDVHYKQYINIIINNIYKIHFGKYIEYKTVKSNFALSFQERVQLNYFKATLPFL